MSWISHRTAKRITTTTTNKMEGIVELFAQTKLKINFQINRGSQLQLNDEEVITLPTIFFLHSEGLSNSLQKDI